MNQNMQQEGNGIIVLLYYTWQGLRGTTEILLVKGTVHRTVWYKNEGKCLCQFCARPFHKEDGEIRV